MYCKKANFRFRFHGCVLTFNNGHSNLELRTALVPSSPWCFPSHVCFCQLFICLGALRRSLSVLLHSGSHVSADTPGPLIFHFLKEVNSECVLRACLSYCGCCAVAGAVFAAVGALWLARLLLFVPIALSVAVNVAGGESVQNACSAEPECTL